MTKFDQFSQWEHEFISQHRIARLATIGTQNYPHLIPIVYGFNGRQLFTPIDTKPKRVSPDHLQRVRNIKNNSSLAVLIDDYNEDWTQLAWILIHGRGTLVKTGPKYLEGTSLLITKYHQYTAKSLLARPLIIIEPHSVRSWRATDQH